MVLVSVKVDIPQWIYFLMSNVFSKKFSLCLFKYIDHVHVFLPCFKQDFIMFSKHIMIMSHIVIPTHLIHFMYWHILFSYIMSQYRFQRHPSQPWLELAIDTILYGESTYSEDVHIISIRHCFLLLFTLDLSSNMF